jgi:curved DNA-binding protein CbpA
MAIYHPDKPTRNEDTFRRVSEAHSILTNPVKRREYDAKLKIEAAKAKIQEMRPPRAPNGHAPANGHANRGPQFVPIITPDIEDRLQEMVIEEAARFAKHLTAQNPLLQKIVEAMTGGRR